MYWKEWLGRGLVETNRVFRPFGIKFIPPILSPVFLFVQFRMGGLIALSAIWKIALCLVESYAMAFVAVYGWKLIVSVPLLLRERDIQIDTHKQYIARLEDRLKTDPIKVEVHKADFGYFAGTRIMAIRVYLTVVTGEVATTLLGWMLHCLDNPELQARLGDLDLGPESSSIRSPSDPLRMEHHDARTGYIRFDLALLPEEQVMKLRWEIRFMASGRDYTVALPADLFVKSAR